MLGHQSPEPRQLTTPALAAISSLVTAEQTGWNALGTRGDRATGKDCGRQEFWDLLARAQCQVDKSLHS